MFSISRARCGIASIIRAAGVSICVVFKPLAAHKARSSFYLIAKNVQPHHKSALVAIQDWIKAWKDVTFSALTGVGREDAFPDNVNESTTLGQQVMKIMDDFGERLIKLG